MAKDMSFVYSLMPTDGLKELKSKKVLRGMKISKDGSWLAIKERATLREQIKWINAELSCREEQMKLL